MPGVNKGLCISWHPVLQLVHVISGISWTPSLLHWFESITTIHGYFAKCASSVEQEMRRVGGWTGQYHVVSHWSVCSIAGAIPLIQSGETACVGGHGQIYQVGSWRPSRPDQGVEDTASMGSGLSVHCSITIQYGLDGGGGGHWPWHSEKTVLWHRYIDV